MPADAFDLAHRDHQRRAPERLDEDLYIDLGCRMSGVLRSVTFRL
jgi:hypothetical protein